MKTRFLYFFIVLTFTGFCVVKEASAQSATLQVVFIRHGEKPLKGDNLNCQGLNRALLLPDLISKKFGVPAYLFVPAMALGEATKHTRMFQTVTPLAVKYNLAINSSYAEKDSSAIAAEILRKDGTVLVVWEHKAIKSIIHAFGITDNLVWPDDDFDSIWILTFKNGKPVLTRDKEGLTPSATCKTF